MTVRMEIDPAYQDTLSSAGLTDFDSFLRIEGDRPTSQHKSRETIPIRLMINGEEKAFFLKRVFNVPLKHSLWPLFRLKRGRSQPAIEWQRCRELAEAGIGVMKPVAFGERSRLGLASQAFLLVEALPIPHTLENWLIPGFPRPAPIGTDLRDRLLFELGDLIKRIGEAGFYWPDISPKHIYAEPHDADNKCSPWTFYLIDVERMERVSSNNTNARRLAESCQQQHLLALCRHLSPLSLSRHDLSQLWSGLGHSDDGILNKCHHASADNRFPVIQSLLRVMDEKAPRLPDDYEHPRCVPLRKVGKMFIDQRVIPWFEKADIRNFQDVFRYTSGDDLLKPGLASHRDRIRMQLSNDDGRSRAFYLKRYRRPPLIEQLHRIRACGLKSSSGWREIHFIKDLSLLGIPTMRGLAFGQKMKGIFEQCSFSITEEIAGRSLEKVIEQALVDPAAVPLWRDRMEIIHQLARITARLHKSNLFHRDLYLCHVFLCQNADGGIVLRLIDLARMIEKKGYNDRWCVKDLASLNFSAPAPLVTRADRLRLLHEYQHVISSGNDTSKSFRQKTVRLIRLIEGRTQRMVRHERNRAGRKGRPD